MDLLVFELIINLLQSLETGFFATYYLDIKKTRHRPHLAIGLGIVIFLEMTCINLLESFAHEGLLYYAYIVTLALFGFIYSKNNRFECIALGCILSILSSVNTLIVISFSEWLFPILSIESEVFMRVFMLCCATIVFAALFAIVVAFRRKLVSLNYKMFPVYTLFIILVNAVVLWQEEIFYNNKFDMDFIKLTIVVIVLIAAIGTKLFYDIQAEYHTAHHSEMLHEQLEKLAVQYAEIQNREQKISSLKHDINNKNTLIKSLIQSNQIEKALNLIDSSTEEVTDVTTTIFTGNIVIDSVINNKKNLAYSKGIDFKIIANTFQLSDNAAFEISGILYNALDNAIENISNDNKQIKVYLDKNDQYFILRIINTVDNKVLEDNPELSTTKSNQTYHGYGIPNMKTIIRKHNGELLFTQQGNEFECKAVFPQNNLH